MMNKISYRLLRLAEFYTLSQRVFNVFNGVGEEEATLKSLLQQLQDGINRLDALMNRVSTNLETEAVFNADLKRDDAFLSLKWYILSLTKRNSATLREAGNLLWNTLNKYGTALHRLSYSEESARIVNFIGDLENLENAAQAVVTGNVADLVNELKAAQAAFEAVLQNRVEVKSQVVDDNSEEACRAIRSAIEDLFQYHEVMQKINPTEQQVTRINQINTIIDETMTTVRARQGRIQAKVNPN